MSLTLTWTTRYATGNGRWLAICWSAEQNKFVAIADNGTNRAMTSQDGITWTEHSGVPAAGWMSVCWGKEAGLFVAVANFGTTRIMTSQDGINWNLRPHPHPTNQLFDVCWSPLRNRFVAVAEWSTDNSNRVLTSSDGITWVAQATPANNQWTGVCWSPLRERFVAVAYTFGAVNNNRVMTSPDGFTWTLQTPASTNSWMRVCWSPLRSLFVAVSDGGNNDRVMTSPDGFTWTGRSAPGAQFRGICWSEEAQLFVGTCWGGTYRIYTSSDGFTWTPQVPSDVNGWYAPCWSKERNRFAVVNRGIRVMTADGPVVNTAPSAPQTLTATAGNSQVILNWFIPASTGGSAILEYIVTMNSVPTPTNSTATSRTITGLTNGTSYTFTVTARNAIGTSGSSNQASATPFTTPSAPIIGTAISLNASAIVNWTPLSQGSSDIITFTTVGSFNFTAPRSGTVEVLIVGGGGGGGGGGGSIGGGGGGGGVIYIPSVNVTANTNYPIVVGAGGASGTNGQNSTAFTAIAAGGGTSGAWPTGIGTAGGSGGGAAGNNGTLNQGGGVSSVSTLGTNSGFIFGCSGGNMTAVRLDTAATGYSTRGAGGGGAGPNGTGKALDTDSNILGDTGQTGMGSGGIGYSSAILGTSYYWGGGGGGGTFSYNVNSVGGYGGWGGGGGGASFQGTGGKGGGFALNSGSVGAVGQDTIGGAGGPNTGGGGGGGSYYHGAGGAGGSGIVVIRYNATNGSNVTGYIVTDNFGNSTQLISGINTSTTTINGLTNEKTYTFKVKARSNNAGDSVDSSPSNIVLPIAPTSITTGTNFIGKTLVIGSTGTSNSDYARVSEFNNNSTGTYLGVMFSATNKQPWFSFRPLNQAINEPIMPWTASLNVYYIYVFSFISDIQVKYNIYEYNGTSTIIKGTGNIGTYTASSPFLQNLTQFWLGRTIWGNDFYNGRYDKVTLYNGDLLALTQATILSTLLTLVQSTASNVYYNSTTNYAFRPTINNFMGVVVNILNYNTGAFAGSTVTTSNITLIGTGTSSGGFLNITGSFVELSTAPIIQTATVGPGNSQITVNWTPPANNGGSIITGYTVTSNPQGRTLTVNGTTITTTFSELNIGTPYTFTVVAINAAGTSQPSAASNSVTAITMTTVPSAPTNVTAISGPNIGQIKVSWIKPSNGGATISEYQIKNFSTNALVLTVYGETTETATVPSTSLTIGTSYRFTVTASNSVGPSTTSAPSSTSITPLTFSFNGAQNYVGGKLDISHNYTQNDISFNWSSSSVISFTSPTLLSNPNNRKYLFIRLEYQKLYIRCIVNFNTNTNTFTFPSSSVLIQEKYNPESFDYNITINTSGQKQTLFNTATYLYTSISTPPVFTFNLSLTNISSFLSSSSSLTSRSNSLTIINGLESSLRPFGERLLEIVAIKIFGHPKARAAISNDNSFYNITQLSTKVFDALNNHRNELGNYYMGIYDIQPNSTSQTINVNNFNIIFPFFLNGATQKSSINLFRNGPNVGGSLLVNGNYNIPLLLTFI